MDAEQQSLRLPEGHLSQSYVSHDCFYSTSNSGLLSSSVEYFPSFNSATPRASRKAFPDEEFNGSDLETPGKQSEESDKEFERELSRTLNRTFAGETNRARPTYRNNVSPAIQKIIRMMRMPCLSTPLATTPTKRAFSAGRLDHLNDSFEDEVNDDSICILRRRLDRSFSPDVASRRHSMDGQLLKTMLAKERDFSMSRVAQNISLSTCQSRGLMDALADDTEPVVSACEMKQSPLCIQMVEKENEVSSEDCNQVSELYLLLMTSNRNQRMKNAAFDRRR
ncbi:hypothetical protein X777_07186 [Ooceraea biroi]|uniref:Uncharacterized protein n=1 Tax=Ooceraea biroi TaxID=2015173 RepID=A0A026WAJ9_OOCBI|nr:hypothetical protein X777_07186 [Ooceraea biroi]